MPQKRQAVGTGVTTSTSSPQSSTPAPDPSSTADPTSNTPAPQPSSTQGSTTNGGSSNGGTTNGGSSGGGGTTNDGSSATGGGGSTSQQQQQPSSTSVPTTVAVTTTNADGSTVTSHISTNTLAPVSQTDTSAVQTTKGDNDDNSVVKIGSTTINPSTLTHKTTVRQPLVTQETRQSTATSFWTSHGQVYSSVYTTENVLASTTGFATATIAPGLAGDGGNGSNLTTHTKSIIGGVVGGIGGAILIGGLAFVAWRLWGKKKQSQDHDDGFWDNSQNDSIDGQKRESSGLQQDDNYHSRYSTPMRTNTTSNIASTPSTNF